MTEFRKDDVIQRYLDLRNQKAALEAAHKQALAPVEAGMEAIETWLLAQMNADGVDSYKTAAGTAYRSERLQARIADRTALRDFYVSQIVDADAPETTRDRARTYTDNLFDLYQARLKLETLRVYLADHDGQPQPGIDVSRVATLNVRT